MQTVIGKTSVEMGIAQFQALCEPCDAVLVALRPVGNHLAVRHPSGVHHPTELHSLPGRLWGTKTSSAL